MTTSGVARLSISHRVKRPIVSSKLCTPDSSHTPHTPDDIDPLDPHDPHVDGVHWRCYYSRFSSRAGRTEGEYSENNQGLMTEVNGVELTSAEINHVGLPAEERWGWALSHTYGRYGERNTIRQVSRSRSWHGRSTTVPSAGTLP